MFRDRLRAGAAASFGMRAWLALPLAALALQAALPLFGSTAEEYERVFNHYKPVRIGNLEHFRQNRGQYLGEVFELRAVVQGNMSGQTGKVLLLRVESGEALQMGVAQLTPLMNSGCAVRMIVKSPQAGDGFELVAIAAQRDVDAVIPDSAHAVVQSAPAAQPGRPEGYPSRGGNPPLGGSMLAVPQSEQQLVGAYARAVKAFNKRLSDAEASATAALIIDCSRRWGVDARLVMAVVAAESRFNPLATSRTGAMGLGQLMPATARGLGVSNAYDPAQNLDGSVRLIRGHLDKGGGDLDTVISLALARYNAGSGAVRRWGGVPPYRETIGYIARVKDYFLQMAPEYAGYVR